MRELGGFEHNLQSLRVVDELEERYAEFPGLNLTFETREGILKHCSAANARQLASSAPGSSSAASLRSRRNSPISPTRSRTTTTTSTTAFAPA